MELGGKEMGETLMFYISIWKIFVVLKDEVLGLPWQASG